MYTLLKFLCGLFVVSLVYDTLRFLFWMEEPSKVRKKYETQSYSPKELYPDDEYDEDYVVGMAFIFTIASVVVSTLLIRRYRRNKRESASANKTLTECQTFTVRVPYPPVKFEEVDRAEYLGLVDSEALVIPSDEEEPETPHLDDCSTDEYKDEIPSFPLSSEVEVRDEETTAVFPCDCNLEQFEQRVCALEHGLKSTEQATKEWAKRIEQTEVELVNLHRQMYNILSKAEFKAPTFEVVDKNCESAGDPIVFRKGSKSQIQNKPVEGTDPLYKTVISSTDLTLEWKKQFEEDVENKISEIEQNIKETVSSETDYATQVHISLLKEDLKKKNEELKGKTREIVKAMEEVVKQCAASKTAIGLSLKFTNVAPKVPTHIVSPYKRIQCAETDGAAATQKPKKAK